MTTFVLVGLADATLLAPAGLSLLVGAGLAITAMAPIVAASRTPLIAYRILFNASTPPNGAEATRLLTALARHGEHVSLIWRFHPADRGSEIGDLSLYIVAPSEWGRPLEGILPRLLPGLWAERVPPPAPLRPGIQGRGVRCWRWDSHKMGTGTPSDLLASGIHIGQLSACTGAWDIEAQVHLSKDGVAALLLAECDLHGDRNTLQRNAGENQVSGGKRPGKQKKIGFAKIIKHDPLLSLGLWPLLGGWVARNEGTANKGQARRKAVKGKAISGKYDSPNEQQTRTQAKSARGSGLLGNVLLRLAALLSVHYPLWEAWSPASGNQRKVRAKGKGAVKARQPAKDVPTSRAPELGGEHEPDGGPGGKALLFPATTGVNSTLDSRSARSLAPSISYSLPHVPEQVLVLGRTTAEDRPPSERVVGLPVLQRAIPAPGTASQGNTMGTGPLTGPLRDPVVPMALHQFAADGLLVAGGTDAWRLNVAGSLARQGAEMGIPMIVIEGGSPPDEPPPIARRGARIEAADPGSGGTGQRLSAGITSAGSAGDPFSPGALGLGGQTSTNKKVANIDLGNPVGSIHLNMLFVPPVRQASSPAAGEAASIVLAFRAALPAQMRFLHAVGVTGTGVGDLVLEAWLWVLLVRHHYVRLRYALNGIVLSSEELSGRSRRHVEEASYGGPAQAKSAQPETNHVLPCPDLPSLLLLMEQSNALVGALQREIALWKEPQWVAMLSALGPVGNTALRSIQAVYDRVQGIVGMDAGDLFRLCAGLRDRLKKAIGHKDMLQMLSGPPMSLHELLDGGPLRLLRVNLAGAYRAVQSPFNDAESVRKRYGLYVLWSVWAFAESRRLIARMAMARAYVPVRSDQGAAQGSGKGRKAAARPIMVLIHGAGAWFGSGSPLSSVEALQEMGSTEAGLFLGTTVSGLRHIRSHGANAYANFGSLMVGPLPVGFEDAPDAALRQLEREGELHQKGAEILTERVARTWGQSDNGEPPINGARLLRVLRRLRDGDAVLVTPMPGGKGNTEHKLTVCTAITGIAVVETIRGEWAQESVDDGIVTGWLAREPAAG